MEKTLEEFQHLKIPLNEIISATNGFSVDNRIGVGGFGEVYIGEVCHYKGRSMVAIKRLNPDPRHGQRKTEFLKEIMALSSYTHENLIALLGYCYEENEVILVYEYASQESLDRHLNSPHLTWARRLKICLDVAKGLCYLHDPRGTHQRLIHHDIKSSNILLDGQWNAKVADFGLSIMGLANEQYSVVVANAATTIGYVDPQYVRIETLTKESGVYSFGVVLLEVLRGRLCYTNCLEKDFVAEWIESYKQKMLNDVIFKDPTIPPLDQGVLEALSNIVYSCLNESREDQPNMADVVTQLEIALDNQEISERKPLFFYEEMIKTVVSPLNYKSNGELIHHLKKGVLLNDGKTWFSLNKKEEHCEMLYFGQCFNADISDSFIDPKLFWHSRYKSRFAMGLYKYSRKSRIKARVKPQFLSPGITYIVNFVFKVYQSHEELQKFICLKYKLPGETKPSIAYLADKRDDGWLMCELYQFTTDKRTIDLEILFEGFLGYSSLVVEGIEFQPLEKVEHNDETQPISDSDVNLPTDYEDIMKLSKNKMQWATRKEAYSIIRKGFLIDDGQKWFSLDKNGKKCLMLSATSVQKAPWQYRKLSLRKSRFGEATKCESRSFHDIDIEIQSQLLSSQTTYASYLVYKLPGDQSRFEGPVEVLDKELEVSIGFIYLVSPQNPVVIKTKADQNIHNSLNWPKKKGIPQQRNDGWMEVQLSEFSTATTAELIPLRYELRYCNHDTTLNGVIIEGVELRHV